MYDCDSMDCGMPDFPVHHQPPELAQTHAHWVGDANQPFHPLSSPFPPALNHSQYQGFSSELALCIRWPKYWSFSFSIIPSDEYSGLISLSIDWFDLLAVQGTLKNSLAPQFIIILHILTYFMIFLSLSWNYCDNKTVNINFRTYMSGTLVITLFL